MPFDWLSTIGDVFDGATSIDPTTIDTSGLFTDPSSGGSFDWTSLMGGGTNGSDIPGLGTSIFPDGAGGFTDLNGIPVDSSGTPLTFGDTSTIMPGGGGPVSPTQVYPDGSGGFTDINGNPVSSSGDPLTYDSNGNLTNGAGDTVKTAQPYTPSSGDQTITPGGTDANGNILDAAGKPILDNTGTAIKAGSAAAKALGYGTTAAGVVKAATGATSGSSLLGSLGNALGLGGNSSPGGSSLDSLLLPLLGGALAGYMLPKALGAGSSGTTIQAPNYYDQFSNIKLPNYNPGQQPIVGLNPGYQMTGTVLPTGPVAPKV
jgi:hypothetical protein